VVRRAGDAVAIHVESHGEVAGHGGGERSIEHQAFEGVVGEAQAGRFEFHGVAQAAERARQHVHADVGAAAVADIERSGSKKANAHRATIIV
jgi:hypothetical protein